MTESVAALEQGMRAPFRDAVRVRGVRGDGAPKDANLWCPRSLRITAGASRRANRSVCSASGPALVRSVALERADRAFSQLLAGTPIGPGGSSDAARVPCCEKARGRRTSSRLTTPHENAPLEGRGGSRIMPVWRAGISLNKLTLSSPGLTGRSSKRRPHFARNGEELLDSRFRGNDRPGGLDRAVP
jgi:hypothetical protein